MKRRLLLTFLLIALPAALPLAAQEPQSAPEAQEQNVYGSVTEYFEKALSPLSVPEICSKIDLLIATGQDTLQQARLAGLAFDYYRDAPVMGQEAVAVYVADHYFLNRKLPWSDPETYPMLYAFAEFNRSSLIGCDAPELILEAWAPPEQSYRQRFSVRNDGGHYKLLYFYDPQCATCREYSRAIAELARTYRGGRLTVFAVNTGSDHEVWKAYCDEHFKDMTAWKVDFHNVTPLEADKDYRKAYGVLSTPALVLIDAQNRIIGRRLDPESARTLLGHYNFADRSTRKLIADICKALEPVDTATADQIGRTLYARMASDSIVYRDTMYELFNHLRDHANHSYQEAAALIAERYILGHGDYFSPEYVERVRYALEVFRMNPVGSIAPDLRLKDTAGVSHRLREKRAKRTLVIFHIVNCPDCRREFEGIIPHADEYARKGLRIVCVYVGKDEAEWKEFARTHDSRWTYLSDLQNRSGLRGLYDVAFVPKIYLLDRRGRILAKEIDAETLRELILTKKR